MSAVHLTGAVAPDRVPEWLAAMDVGVAPYPELPDFYFSPLKLYEYMAAALPVVASRVGDLDQIVQHEVTGLLCTPGGPGDDAGPPAPGRPLAPAPGRRRPRRRAETAQLGCSRRSNPGPGGSQIATCQFALVGNRVLTEVRDDLYRHLQRLSLSFHNKAKTGELTIRVIGDINLLKETTVTALLPLLASVLVLVGMIGVMLWVNWRLALLALLPLPLLWLTSLHFGKRIHAVSRKQRQREGAMAATAAESLAAIRDIQALSLEKTFASEGQKSLKEGVQAKRLAANLERTGDVLIGFSSALVLWQGARLVLTGVLTPGNLIVFLTYLKNTFRPIREFAKYTGRLARAAAGERVVDLLEQTAEVRDLPNARPAPPFADAICFERVSFGYEPDQPVLNRIDLCVEPGEQVAVVGPSGMGKSTLVGLLLRLHDPSDGRVLIDGVDIREYRLDSLRAQISIVLPDSLLFAASVRDNIGYGAADAGFEEIESAARLANAHEFITALPNGYDTVLGERGVTLSSGQRQRIAIARAALRCSPILILDEPTTGLDRSNEQAVIEALENLAQGRTVLMITHDLELAARADRIVYLEAGEILEQGAHAELLGRDPRRHVGWPVATARQGLHR